jgi:hypothetical protein
MANERCATCALWQRQFLDDDDRVDGRCWAGVGPGRLDIATLPMTRADDWWQNWEVIL